MSAVYRARPVTFSTASIRGTRWPTMVSFASSPQGSGFRDGISTTLVSSRPSTSTLVVTMRLCVIGSPPGLRRGQNCANDLGIRTAPAQVAAHAADHVALGRVRILPEQRDGGEDLAGGTEAALEGVVLDERRLHGVELVGL